MKNRCQLYCLLLLLLGMSEDSAYGQRSYVHIPPDYAIRIKKEEFSGLDGEVLVRGKTLIVPTSQWSVVTQMCQDHGQSFSMHARKQPLAKDEAIVSFSGGYFKHFKSGQNPTGIFTYEEYRAHLNNKRCYLSYPLSGDPGMLVVTTTPGDNTAWKAVNFVRNEKKMSHRNGHYDGELTVEYQLEALNRPGWFLTIDDKKRLTLTNEQPPKHTLKYFLRAYFDNLNDGK